MLVPCAALPLKLHHFFEFAGQATGEHFPIKDKAGIADHLGVPRARVTEWTQADESKNRPANSVQDAHVLRLAALYAELAPAPISVEEAYRYWRYHSAEAFRDGLVHRGETRGLFRLLKERPQAIEILIEEHGDGMGMMDEMAAPARGSRCLARDKRFALHVPRLRGRSIYLLVEAPEGIFLHVPGRSFDGVLRRNPQRLPPEKWWRFSTDGAHRLLVIELVASVPPAIRDPSATGPLSESELERLVAALEDPWRSLDWSWGATAIHVGGMDEGEAR